MLPMSLDKVLPMLVLTVGIVPYAARRKEEARQLSLPCFLLVIFARFPFSGNRHPVRIGIRER